MGQGSADRTFGAAALAAAALAGCGQPAWRDPATARGTAALAPAVVRVAAEDATARRRSAHADHATAEAMPPPPDWAADLLGKPLRVAFPALGDCIGNTDAVKARFGDGLGGSKIAGWGWDPTHQAPVPRVVLADRDFRIVGAGASGARRRDVPRAVPSVTSETTGWEALTPLNAGPVDAWGVLADGKTVCKLGHLEL
ncbi:MAG: hypothetical protein JWP50_1977 [Phenylobacterium sp.]|nr:hypothetical protein [Phenylobacterium sp.]